MVGIEITDVIEENSIIPLAIGFTKVAEDRSAGMIGGCNVRIEVVLYQADAPPTRQRGMRE